LGVNNRDPASLDRMLELLVAAGLSNLEPTVLLELADDLPAVHNYGPSTSRIHISCTLINDRKLPGWSPMMANGEWKYCAVLKIRKIAIATERRTASTAVEARE